MKESDKEKTGENCLRAKNNMNVLDAAKTATTVLICLNRTICKSH